MNRGKEARFRAGSTAGLSSVVASYDRYLFVLIVLNICIVISPYVIFRIELFINIVPFTISF